MLGVPDDGSFCPADVPAGADLFSDALLQAATIHHLPADALSPLGFEWISTERRLIRAIPRDNSDFAACGYFSIEAPAAQIHEVIATVRACWIESLKGTLPSGPSTLGAASLAYA
jgi:hypothetical protein